MRRVQQYPSLQLGCETEMLRRRTAFSSALSVVKEVTSVATDPGVGDISAKERWVLDNCSVLSRRHHNGFPCIMSSPRRPMTNDDRSWYHKQNIAEALSRGTHAVIEDVQAKIILDHPGSCRRQRPHRLPLVAAWMGPLCGGWIYLSLGSTQELRIFRDFVNFLVGWCSGLNRTTA